MNAPWVGGGPRPLVVGGGAIGLTLVIGLADFLTGSEASIALFYLIPIALTTWLLGRAGKNRVRHRHLDDGGMDDPPPLEGEASGQVLYAESSSFASRARSR